jgi:hypothetical protein
MSSLLSLPPGWIQTYTGRAFGILNPHPDDIVIEDIAHSLSQQCRYAGHCVQFASVAEHCRLMWELASKPNKRPALLHDATEAYLVDVPRPIKELLPDYKKIEHVLAAVIAAKFGVAYPWPEEVLQLDARILLDERAQNMVPFLPRSAAILEEFEGAEGFTLGDGQLEGPNGLAGYTWTKIEESGWPFHLEPLGVKLQFWSPAEAEEKFLEAFFTR